MGDVSGRVVTTVAFGSRYQLLNPRPELTAELAAIGAEFDPEDPLNDPGSLLQAWTRVEAKARKK